MARPLRLDFPGAVHHVTTRGNAQAAIFVDDGDRRSLLGVLDEVVALRNWRCHAYCLMDNHYHLLVETPEGNLSAGMRQLNGVYTQRFNRRHHRVGHLFQGRFKAILVERESHLLELSRYVVLNPVRAGMVAEPAAYPWSSYTATVGLVKRPSWLVVDWIVNQFGADFYTARRLYAQFVAEGRNTPSPMICLRGQFMLGGTAFAEAMRAALDRKTNMQEIPRGQRLSHRPALTELFPESPGVEKRVRDTLIARAHRDFGYSLAAIGRAVGLHYSTVSRIVNGER